MANDAQNLANFLKLYGSSAYEALNKIDKNKDRTVIKQEFREAVNQNYSYGAWKKDYSSAEDMTAKLWELMDTNTTSNMINGKYWDYNAISAAEIDALGGKDGISVNNTNPTNPTPTLGDPIGDAGINGTDPKEIKVDDLLAEFLNKHPEYEDYSQLCERALTKYVEVLGNEWDTKATLEGFEASKECVVLKELKRVIEGDELYSTLSSSSSLFKGEYEKLSDALKNHGKDMQGFVNALYDHLWNNGEVDESGNYTYKAKQGATELSALADTVKTETLNGNVFKTSDMINFDRDIAELVCKFRLDAAGLDAAKVKNAFNEYIKTLRNSFGLGDGIDDMFATYYKNLTGTNDSAKINQIFSTVTQAKINDLLEYLAEIEGGSGSGSSWEITGLPDSIAIDASGSYSKSFKFTDGLGGSATPDSCSISVDNLPNSAEAKIVNNNTLEISGLVTPGTYTGTIYYTINGKDYTKDIKLVKASSIELNVDKSSFQIKSSEGKIEATFTPKGKSSQVNASDYTIRVQDGSRKLPKGATDNVKGYKLTVENCSQAGSYSLIVELVDNTTDAVVATKEITITVTQASFEEQLENISANVTNTYGIWNSSGNKIDTAGKNLYDLYNANGYVTLLSHEKCSFSSSNSRSWATEMSNNLSNLISNICSGLSQNGYNADKLNQVADIIQQRYMAPIGTSINTDNADYLIRNDVPFFESRHSFDEECGALARQMGSNTHGIKVYAVTYWGDENIVAMVPIRDLITDIIAEYEAL